MVRIEYLKLKAGAQAPEKMTEGSAGFDLRACLEEPVTLEPHRAVLVPTGLALAIPPGYEGQIRPRSGLALKYGVTLANSPGTIDSDYRGPLNVILVNHGSDLFTVKSGDRIAQLVIARVEPVRFEEAPELGGTSRGGGGFGHTGTS